ncbi:CHAD domain-containing protein [Streptomyces marispadix]|uniref:CHAD domain-containing protein n=1 Tax=Streptomyces marispadix TaxID=2922868 RepID=A0ABS9SXU5_9ACTN|nr:CHAD domain-containing protein [Streptomyces marispadix]MCH6161082.1 CHAD domain-containing protein [Streptomyces marispadix]
MRVRGGDLAGPAGTAGSASTAGPAGAAGHGGAGGAAGPAGPIGGGGCAAPARTLETADAAEVLSGCLNAWAADFMRSLRLHQESASSAQTATAAADAVRQLRRASRRIGSALLTYRSFVDAAWADELSAELRRLSGTLAYEYRCAARQARLLAALHRLAVEGVGGDRAAALLERQHSLARSRAHSAALEALVSSRFHAVADAVALLAYEVPLAPDAARGSAGTLLLPPAERAWERLVHAVESLPPASRAYAGRREGPEGPDPGAARTGGDSQSRQDAAWLEVRILLRHHRYAREVLCAADGQPPGGAREGGGHAGTAGEPRTGTDVRTDAGAEARTAGRTDARTDARTAARTEARTGARTERDIAEAAHDAHLAQPQHLPHDRAVATGPDDLLVAASAALDAHRDAIEAAEAAAAAARTPRIAPATAYALGVLHAGQRQEAESARREFRGLWQQVVSGRGGMSGTRDKTDRSDSDRSDRADRSDRNDKAEAAQRTL